MLAPIVRKSRMEKSQEDLSKLISKKPHILKSLNV